GIERRLQCSHICVAFAGRDFDRWVAPKDSILIRCQKRRRSTPFPTMLHNLEQPAAMALDLDLQHGVSTGVIIGAVEARNRLLLAVKDLRGVAGGGKVRCSAEGGVGD